VHPRIGAIRQRVTVQVKDFYDSIPHRLTLENFFNWDAFAMRGYPAV
jgi:hypothetical protein